MIADVFVDSETLHMHVFIGVSYFKKNSRERRVVAIDLRGGTL
jgi:hypothetical protein